MTDSAVTQLTEGTLVLSLRGDLDLATVTTIEPVLEETRWKEVSTLVLDMTEVTFVDSSGLRLILGARRRADEAGARFAMRNVPAQARRLLSITGVSELLNVEPDEG